MSDSPVAQPAAAAPPANPVPAPAAKPAEQPKAQPLPAPILHVRNDVTWDLSRADHLTKHLQGIGQNYGAAIQRGKATDGFASVKARVAELSKLLGN